MINVVQHTKNIYQTLAEMHEMCDHCLLLEENQINLQYEDVSKMYSCFTNSLFAVEKDSDIVAYVKQKFFDVSVQRELYSKEIEQRGIISTTECLCVAANTRQNELYPS